MGFENDWEDSSTTFSSAFDSVDQLVQRTYDNGEADLLFKGTWYTHFLYEDVRRLARQRRWNKTGFHERALCCLAMSLPNNSPWATSVADIVSRILKIHIAV